MIRKLLTTTNVVTLMLVSPCFRTPFASKRVHRCQTLLKPGLQHFNYKFPLILELLSWKRSPLVRSEILGLFVNALAPDDMDSRYR